MDFKEKKVPKIHTSYFLTGKSMYQLRLKMQKKKLVHKSSTNLIHRKYNYMYSSKGISK